MYLTDKCEFIISYVNQYTLEYQTHMHTPTHRNDRDGFRHGSHIYTSINEPLTHKSKQKPLIQA